MTCRIRTGDRQFLHCCSTTEPTSSGTSPASLRHTHHGSAARTGRALGTRAVEGFCADAPYGRLSPTGHSHGAAWLLSTPLRFPHHPRRSIGTRRTCAGMEVPLPRWRTPPDASGRSGTVKHSMHAHPLANAGNKTPPGGNPRAFALPREIGATDLHGQDQSMKRRPSLNRWNCRGARRPASRISGDVFGLPARKLYVFMEWKTRKTVEQKNQFARMPDEGSGDYARHSRIASIFSKLN